MNPFNHPQLLAWRARLVPEDKGMGWMPFLTLGYMGFLAMPALLPHMVRLNPHWVLPTVLVSLLFLPLYFRAYWAKGRELVLILLATWALALVLVRFNPFANNLIIFACAFAPWIGRLRDAALFALALALSYSVYSARFDSAALFSAAITFLVGTACFFGTHFFTQDQRKRVALRLSHEEVRRLAALAERERIGRDLHDLLGHTLSLIAIKSELANRLWDRDANAARQEVREVERVAREALAQVRRAVTGIRAAGLAAELASARLMLETCGIAFRYDIEHLSLPLDVETSLALAVREAVTNIQRHARASRASVQLRRDGERLLIEVSDDGCGGDIVPGNGLTGMRERLQDIGGSLSVDSLRGQGTRLLIHAPCRGNYPAEQSLAAE